MPLRAVLRRLNRSLRREKSLEVHAPRGRGPHTDAFFIVSTTTGFVVEENVTAARIEEMARQHSVVANWEEVR